MAPLDSVTKSILLHSVYLPAIAVYVITHRLCDLPLSH